MKAGLGSDKEKRSTASELEAREVAEVAREEEWGKQELRASSLRRHASPCASIGPAARARSRRTSASRRLPRASSSASPPPTSTATRSTARAGSPPRCCTGSPSSAPSASRSRASTAGSASRRLTYNRAVALSRPLRPTGALLSAHQSIGVPQPLKLFGTDGAEAAVPAAPRGGRDLARSR